MVYKIILPEEYNLIRRQDYDKYWSNQQFQGLNLSPSFKDLFVRMVAFNPKERPLIDEILIDDWLQEINNLNDEQINALENEIRLELQQREAGINIDDI